VPEESPRGDLVGAIGRAFEALNSGNWDALMSLWAPNGVWEASPMGLGTYEGHAAMRSHFQEWWNLFDDYHHGLEETLDLGNGVTLAVIVVQGTFPGTGGPFKQPWGTVGTWADGLLTRTTAYADPDEARAAAERLAEERG
jgi:ketosteroid isomerase-like protein